MRVYGIRGLDILTAFVFDATIPGSEHRWSAPTGELQASSVLFDTLLIFSAFLAFASISEKIHVSKQ